jgi:integrase
MRENVQDPVLRPAMKKAGVDSSYSFHSFRHSVASMLIAEGRNIVQCGGDVWTRKLSSAARCVSGPHRAIHDFRG